MWVGVLVFHPARNPEIVMELLSMVQAALSALSASLRGFCVGLAPNPIYSAI